ncbi:LOW QUALITY PROTEIN: hypothetical protein FOWG_06020 [Fusarium oxysporum f. sp. lycopersici MN25]|nr:LOW QUALITY PROTEIN: hypothetical protein FOWG_06020 [Fusarium oxysporum f. sp. lycopersici MN25]
MPRLIEIVLGKPSPGPGGLLSFPQFIYNFLHRPVHATREYRLQELDLRASSIKNL